MTVVIGVNWFTEILMLADTRVSWTGGWRSPEDNLRKLYTLSDQRKTAVLGFSGEIRAAQIVMKYLIEEKFQHMKRRFVIARLRDDLRTWLEEISIAKLSEEERSSLNFMLCGLEPYRPPFWKERRKSAIESLLESRSTSVRLQDTR